MRAYRSFGYDPTDIADRPSLARYRRIRRVRDCALQSPLVTISAGEFVFFDQLVQGTSEENGVVQPDVPVWLLMVGCSQAAALDLNQKQCPQVGGEGVTGPGL